jgi:FAD/FMN-containing dehydrogenase
MNTSSTAWARLTTRLHLPAGHPAQAGPAGAPRVPVSPARPPDPADPADLAGLAGLAARVAGPVLTPGDDGYDAERAGHNLVIDDRPAVIVGAAGAADVIAAVGYAAGHGLPVAVRCTGHTAAVPADGGVLITTRRMQGIRIDPATATATVEAGVRMDRLIHEAAAFGLAPLSGSAPSVGVAGYLLGGGLPLLGRAFGYAADHVRGLDVVTAPGSCAGPARDSTRICSGRCAAARATSAW